MSSRNGHQKSTEAISRIGVGGLKSLKDKQSIEIRPLTILAGANSSGKSSMMQGLLLLKQTLEATYDPGPLLIRGPNVEFTAYEQLLFHGAGASGSHEIELDLTITGLQEISLVYGSNKRKPRSSLTIRSQKISESRDQFFLGMNLNGAEKNVLADQLRGKFNFGETDFDVQVSRDRCFLNVDLFHKKDPEPKEKFMRIRFDTHFISVIERVIHLPGLRGNPTRTYPVTAAGNTFPGTFQVYAASLIAQWENESREKLSELGDDLRSLGLTWKVAARLVDASQIEIRVGRLAKPRRGGSQDLVSIADVGFGVSQTLPVAVALIAAEPGQLVYIEQPEIHLHPRAQLAMARLLAKAAQRGVQVVAETHSSIILLGVQTLIAQGELDPALVKLHWFTRDPSEGTTTVESTDLDEVGRFGEWPVDFADVSLRAQSRYLDAAGARLEAGLE